MLHLWETGLNLSLVEKSLRLLAVACAATTDEMGDLSIGERDARLLQLREGMFGSRLQNIAHCPHCAAPLEWETNAGDLYLQPPSPETIVRECSLTVEEFSLRFRLLNSRDLLQAASHPALHDPQKLLAGCILRVQQGAQDHPADALPDAVWEALDQRMGEEDPQADIQMAVRCPVCSYSWEVPFDIMSYLWIEIDNWARHLLHEVYLLARAFGWPERDILGMSTQRRQLYLEMLRS